MLTQRSPDQRVFTAGGNVAALSNVSRSLWAKVLAYREETVRLFALDLHPTASIILDEGAKLITSGGGGAITMRIVAANAKIKLASLQYHFSTFEELVSTLFLREWGRIADLIWNSFQDLEKAHENPVEVLRKSVERFMVGEYSPKPVSDRLYFHLMAFCSYYEKSSKHVEAFYHFYNTLFAFIISRVNVGLSEKECFNRSILIIAALEGSNIYTILGACGDEGEMAMHSEVGNLAVYYASLPSK